MKERASAMKKPKSGFYFRFSLCTKVVKLRRFYVLVPNKILKTRGDKRALVEMVLESDWRRV